MERGLVPSAEVDRLLLEVAPADVGRELVRRGFLSEDDLAGLAEATCVGAGSRRRRPGSAGTSSWRSSGAAGAAGIGGTIAGLCGVLCRDLRRAG